MNCLWYASVISDIFLVLTLKLFDDFLVLKKHQYLDVAEVLDICWAGLVVIILRMAHMTILSPPLTFFPLIFASVVCVRHFPRGQEIASRVNTISKVPSSLSYNGLN